MLRFLLRATAYNTAGLTLSWLARAAISRHFTRLEFLLAAYGD